mgnify:CR=1 FL=1
MGSKGSEIPLLRADLSAYTQHQGIFHTVRVVGTGKQWGKAVVMTGGLVCNTSQAY